MRLFTVELELFSFKTSSLRAKRCAKLRRSLMGHFPFLAHPDAVRAFRYRSRASNMSTSALMVMVTIAMYTTHRTRQ